MISTTPSSVALLIVASLGTLALAQPAQDYSGDCSRGGCHDAFGQQASVHDPVASDSCDDCHRETDKQKHQFQLTTPATKLCLECHDEYEGKVLHSPVSDGDCTVCHDPHASSAKALLRGPTAAALCAECHDEVTEGRQYLHGPVATGACTTCHNPHASDHTGLLRAENRAVCAMCHEAVEAGIASQAYQHGPALEECTSCHDPHGAGNRMNLKTTPPDLCVDCHDGVAEVMEDAPVKHDARTTGKSCSSCHNPHASDVEHLLIQEQMDLCLSCHNKKVESGEDQFRDIAALLSENPNHHGPIREKNCTGCHVGVHGGEHFRLLRGEYPAEFYAPFHEDRYALCFSCHEPTLVRDERTTKLTGFRNGDQNLHYLHVNRRVKGRTCRACHNSHASKRPRHITDAVPFGKWDLPVNFKESPTGGSCLPGCHMLYRYDREKAIINLPPQ